MTTRKTKAQKARSAAARKGWETRKEQRRAKFIAGHQQAYKAGFDFAESMQRVNSECAREMVWGDLRQPDPPAPPPICTDCKYIRYSSDASLVRCAAPQLSTDPTVNRAHQHLCGARGRFFSPKGPPAAPSPQQQALGQLIRFSKENDRAFLYDEVKVAEAFGVPGGFTLVPHPKPPTFLQRILGWFR